MLVGSSSVWNSVKLLPLRSCFELSTSCVRLSYAILFPIDVIFFLLHYVVAVIVQFLLNLGWIKASFLFSWILFCCFARSDATRSHDSASDKHIMDTLESSEWLEKWTYNHDWFFISHDQTLTIRNRCSWLSPDWLFGQLVFSLKFLSSFSASFFAVML